MDVVAYFASNQGKLLTKPHLMEQFWPGQIITDWALASVIHRARKALDDDPKQPQYLETVGGKGFRFIASVRIEDTPRPPDALEELIKGRGSLESLDAARLPDAVAGFERLVASQPDAAPGHVGLAAACFLQFQGTRASTTPDRHLLERAIAHARRGVALAERLPEAWGTLGFVLTATDDVIGARTALRRAVELQPGNWRHYFRLAAASWGQERLDALDRTLDLMPNFAPAYHLGCMVHVARQAFPFAERMATAGAVRQTQEATGCSPFPPFGMHRIQGLMQLRKGDANAALTSFACEREQTRRGSIYSPEFQCDALVGTGYVHLSTNNLTAATDAFRAALVVMPDNGRALIGLARACPGDDVMRRLADVIERVKQGGRTGEGALLTAGMLAINGDAAGVCAAIESVVCQGEPRQDGWMVSIDPALAAMRGHEGFERIVAVLAARAS